MLASHIFMGGSAQAAHGVQSKARAVQSQRCVPWGEGRRPLSHPAALDFVAVAIMTSLFPLLVLETLRELVSHSMTGSSANNRKDL